MSLTRRPAVESDREFLWKLQCEAMRPHVEAIWGWDEADQRGRFAAGLRIDVMEILECDGTPAGVIELRREPAVWFLARIALLPGFQGKGTGTVLIRELCAAADATGVSVRLQVFKSNPAHRLYSRLGFNVVETTSTHHIMLRQPPDA